MVGSGEGKRAGVGGVVPAAMIGCGWLEADGGGKGTRGGG